MAITVGLVRDQAEAHELLTGTIRGTSIELGVIGEPVYGFTLSS
jgi:hypothetical protein